MMLDESLFDRPIWDRNDERTAFDAFESARLNHLGKKVGFNPLSELCHEVRPDREAQMLVENEFIALELDHKMCTKVIPTVWLDVISLVASSCGYNRSEIEHRAAH